MWGWEIVNQVKGRFCKKVLRIPTSAANRAEGKLGIRSRRGIISSATVRYWARIKCRWKVEPMRHCYKWQIGKFKV